MRVLVTGGSGYLGQFVVQKLSAEHSVVSTWQTSKPTGDEPAQVEHVQCDFSSDEQTSRLFDERGPFDAVVNTAAISQPGSCQQDPDRARALNVPTALLAELRRQRDGGGPEATLVHLSTDQVYDGGHALWTEAEDVKPVNAYGLSKEDAEHAIRAVWPCHAILRSSIIYGPQSPTPVARPLFVQFVEESLRLQQPRKFFSDEFRSPIYVKDLVSVILFFLSSCNPAPISIASGPAGGSGGSLDNTFNAGGPDRLSRLGITEAVAAHCGYSTACVEAAESASVVRAAPSPLDISMDSSKLAARLPFKLTPFSAALKDIFPDKS